MSDQKNSKLVAPILFSAQVDVTTGRSALADTGALSTKFRRPFIIDEVRWAVSAVAEESLVTDAFTMQTRLRLGRFQLSDRYIPLPNYAPILNDFCECNQPFFAGGQAQIAWYRWKLPKPLLVPPGMTLVSDFFRPLGKTPATVTVDVAYAGRYLPELGHQKLPREVDVPWVTLFTPAASSVFAQSSELDLYNPFNVPLEVQRFLAANQDTAPDIGGNTATVSQDQITVMKDSMGTNVVRDFTATGAVFDINRRAWTFNKVLAPKERFNITLQALSGDLSDYNVSIVGTRKEAL